MINSLYIIGNGFDIHHGLNTQFKDFKDFLEKKNESELIEQLENYYAVDYEELWSDFEAHLADLDSETLLDEFSDYIAVPSRDEFRDRDWNTYAFEVDRVISNLTISLCEKFRLFILEQEKSPIDNTKTIVIDTNAKFFNFNYSNTLERHYKIKSNNILYIHGFAENPSSTIILGHAKDPSISTKKDTPPEGLDEEELEEWISYQNDQYDYSTAQAISVIEGYFNKTFKNTESIIQSYPDFISRLSCIDNVLVLGHSLSEVDLPYFVKLKSIINPNSSWTFSYHTDDDYQRIRSFIMTQKINTDQTKIIKLSDLIAR